MYLLWWFRSISIQYTQYQSLNNMSKMWLNWTTLFWKDIVTLVLDLLFNMILVDCYRFVVNYLPVLEWVYTTKWWNLFSESGLFYHTVMDPIWHLLSDNILRYLQLLTQILRTDPISIILDLILIKISNKYSLYRRTLKIKTPILKR